MEKVFVVVRSSFDAVHCWPECPYNEVSFLRYPHRHKFYVKLKVEVTSSRQVEFFILKSELDKVLEKFFHEQDLKSKSCEEISKIIASEFLHKGYIVCQVDVFEDNENGVEFHVM